MIAGDMNAQVGRLSDSETQLGGCWGLQSKRTDNGERLLQLCAGQRLFLSSTNFRNSRRRLATWCSPSESYPRVQIDHIAISHRWRGSITECRSFWNTSVDSDHALVRCCLSLRFPGKRVTGCHRIATSQLQKPHIRKEYQNHLSEILPAESPSDLNTLWSTIEGALRDAGTSACGITENTREKHWISDATMRLIDARRALPVAHDNHSQRRKLRRQIASSLGNDREKWWSDKATEMEKAHQAGNSRKLFQLIRSTGPRKPGVSEVINNRNGDLITNKEERLDRWAEHFQEQFSWPSTTKGLDFSSGTEPWTVDQEPPTSSEIREHLVAMKRHRAAGPDDISPSLLKDGGDALITHLTRLCESIWKEETVPEIWGESIIVPIFKKGARNECSNHRGISLTPVITRLLASILRRRLLAARESTTREQQAGFRPGRGCIDHIFTLRQVLEQRHVYRRPTISIFLDFKGAFDSVDRSVLMDTLTHKGVPGKFVRIISSLYRSTTGRVRVYGELSKSFPTTSGVRQGCPLSPFLFNFIIDEILDHTIGGSNCSGVHLTTEENLVDLEYADDIVLLFEHQHEAQECLDRLSETIQSFGMCFAPSKCKVMLQDCLPLANPFVINGLPLEIVDRFVYLGSCISSDCSVSNEIKSRIAKARTTFANLHHLWCNKKISLKLKGRVYQATVRAVLLYGSETWPLRVEDSRQLEVFDNRCLRSIARVGWRQRVRMTDVRNRIFGVGSHQNIASYIQHSKLRWLGHLLRMPESRLPKRVLLSRPVAGWRKPRGGQSLTWQKEMKTITRRLSVAGSSRLPGWGLVIQTHHGWRRCKTWL